MITEPIESSAATLTAAVLDEEAARLASQTEAEEARVLDDAELYGVGDETLTLRQGMRIGGFSTLALLALLNVVDQLDNGAVSVLAPDIKKSLGMSDTVIAVSTIAATLFMIGAGLVLGRFADTKRRPTIIGLATAAWGACALFTSLVTSALLYFVARALTGIGRSNTQVVQGPILADAYPINARPRIFAVHSIAGSTGGLVAPLVIGGMVTFIGGGDAWRWGFVAIAVPTILLGIVALFLPDPPRGQFEQRDTIGEVIDTKEAPPISLGAAYQRVMQIRTYKNAMVAFTALGFSWVAVPVFLNLYLADHFGLSAFERALVARRQ